MDLGRVTVAGLKVPVTIDPVQPGNAYFETSLPNPAFEPGAAIRLTTSGGDVEPLSLDGVGVEPLRLAEEQWDITRGQDLEIRWTAPESSAPTRVFVGVNIDQHGTSPVTLSAQSQLMPFGRIWRFDGFRARTPRR